MKRNIMIIAALCLSACDEMPDNIKHSKVAAICHDGTYIVRSDIDKQLRTIKYNSGFWSGRMTGEIDAGLKAQDVCR